MQKRARPSLDANFLAVPLDLKRVERLYGRLRLAQGIAKGREIVVPDEMARALLHRLDIERWRDMPDKAALQHRRRAAVEDAIAVMPAPRRAARVKGGRRRLGCGDGDRVRA